MKMITLRLADEEYKILSENAKKENRSINNYIVQLIKEKGK